MIQFNHPNQVLASGPESHFIHLTKDNEIKTISSVPHLSYILSRDSAYNKNLTEAKENFFKTLDGKSCAVVGASSNLINSGYGKFIDNHDAVFRINDHRVNKLYQKDIGKKLM